jgi:hypothetical protein
MQPLLSRKLFAGLASLVEKTLGGLYGVGLWKEDLHKGFGWYVVKRQNAPGVPAEHNDQAVEYVAPSWS